MIDQRRRHADNKTALSKIVLSKANRVSKIVLNKTAVRINPRHLAARIKVAEAAKGLDRRTDSKIVVD